jgi:glycosyltransferase involved in cell wall biosynthesis
VDTRAFAPPSNRGEVRHRLFSGRIPPNAKVVLAVGDFAKESGKRLDWIVEEIAKMKLPVHLILAGNGDDVSEQALRTVAEGRLKERVHILRGVPHGQMPAVYHSADLFVHGATREPFGIVFIEAMASGLPAIGHDFEVTKWIIGDGGRAIDTTQPGALAHECERILADDSLRERLGTLAMGRAKSTFDKDIILRKYHEWYEELVMRRR